MRFSRALHFCTALVAAVLLAGCAGEYPQSSIDPKSDFAWVIQDLYVLVTWICLVILVAVWGLLGYTLVRFRERPDSEKPKQIHGHTGLEIGWTILPAVIVVIIAIPTIRAVFETQRPGSDDAMIVEVIGHQFWWEFRYPDSGIVTANELHLPVGQPISLRMHSADVLHSFWIPMLGGKRDVNPLRAVPEGDEPHYNWLHFTIEEPGVYLGQCAEFCGESHSLMGMQVVAHEAADFQAWTSTWQASTGAPTQALPAGLDPAVVAEGQALFANASCIACHAIQGTTAQGAIGPSLTLLGQRGMFAGGWVDTSVEGLVEWITAPGDVKPGALMPGVNEAGGNFPATGLTPEQVEAIAQYLYSLR